MGKIADSVTIINIIKVSFERIQVTRDRWKLLVAALSLFLIQEEKTKKLQVITIDQLFDRAKELSLGDATRGYLSR